MNIYVNNHNILLIVLITFLASFLIVPLAKKIALHIGAIDCPDERKVHIIPTPRLGGLAIFLAFLVGYMLFAKQSTEMLAILIGGFLTFFVGFIDDIKPVRARYKFIGQIIAASVIPIYGGIILKDINAFGLTINFGILSIPFTIFFIVAIMNAINFIDGIDGLSSGIAAIYFLTIGIIAIIMNKMGGLDIVLCFIMLGSTIGFLVHNFPPATIFVGDAGAYFFGYIIAVIALLGFKNVTMTSLIIPLVILAIPILDVISSILRRTIKKQKWDHADKEHFHHQLLKMNLGTKKTILIIYLVDIAFASVSIFYVLGDRKIAMVVYMLLMILLVIFVMKTNLIFEHKKKRGKK